MRILLVSHQYPPYAMGGVEVYTRNLARTLRENHSVAVFFRHDDKDGSPFVEHDQEVDGILTRRVSCNPGGLEASVAGEFFDTFLGRQIEATDDEINRLVYELYGLTEDEVRIVEAASK